MPPRKAPTARQRRLGAELRKIREDAGISITEAAAQLNTDRTGMSNVESGRFGVSSERVRSWTSHYRCPDPAYVDALAAMAEERGRGWWDEYRDDGLAADLIDLAELEHHAVALRQVQIMHMPGLLQTEEYARAVFGEAVPALQPPNLRRLLSYRMKRRDVLDRKNPPACVFLIHEAALRMRFGGRRVTSGQLDYLLKQSDRDNVTVLVIPFEAGGFPDAGSSTVYTYGPVRQLDTVQSDTPTGSILLDAETRLANYRAVLDRAQERAYDPERSRDFIREMAQQV
ncbi:Scr1 family TA system antitoxin-like transcriptional regulator [Streptomyces sp. H34-S4]|uniref:Scr1 family TA system antitoxin-like transcriptional regulator n=1 Tax=Streptomyces sp. H34-S4 TaxID=2996463 RepID=UPI002272173F|nr:Scr1 family TA system antitoxin-like transcriptional regulator [Streptomyces sp. H34-S4]MCY0936111.1 Scr1 family TA system antitoxin-like transcriptional regulator [Streptomyces sp. H34-S4]